MTEAKHYKPEIVSDKGHGMLWQILVFTIIFVATAAAAYSYFIMGNSTFLTAAKGGNKDGIAQIYPSYIAVKHIIQGLIAGEGFSAWNWSIGLGGDNWNMFASKLANPFTYLIIAFPEDKIDLGYTLVAVLKQYCAGLAFLFFGRKAGLDYRRNLLGAMCYAFSMWMFMTATAQSGFDTAAILFPLLVLGAEKICDGESPLIFIISVFFFLTAGVIWGYASGIMIIVYYFIRQILKGEVRDFRKFMRTTGAFMLAGICGVLIASAFVAEILLSMTSATTDTGAGKETWYTLSSYLALPKALYRTAGTGASSYSAIGLPIVSVILWPLIIPRAIRGKHESVMALLCLIGTQIPAVCRMFNGFSYASGRWFYMVAFFMTWASIECFREETFRSLLKCFIMELWLAATSGWVIYRYFHLGMDNKKTAFTAICGLMFGTMIILIGHISSRRAGHGELAADGSSPLRIRGLVLAMIVMITMADIAEIEMIATFSHAHNGVAGYSKIGEAYEAMTTTNEAAIRTIQDEDKDFYRYNKAGGYYGIRTVGAVINTSIALGTRPIYTCFSSAPSAWHLYNKTVGNGTGNYRRTLVDGNDGRAMLDYLMGVKYFGGRYSDPEIKKNGRASMYVPYGYDKFGDVDGYEVFINSYCMGLGTTYPQYITESEFAEYPVQVREQVLMQTAVVPDKYADKLDGVRHARSQDIVTEISANDIEVSAGDGIEIDMNTGTLIVRDPAAMLEVTTSEKIEDRQMLVAFENLTRQDMTYEDLQMLLHGKVPDENSQSFAQRVARKSYKDKPGFKITTKQKVRKDGKTYNIINGTKSESGSVRSFRDLENFDINLGYFDKFTGKFNVKIDNTGIYHFDAIRLYSVPMDIFDDNAAILDSRKYQITEWGDDYVDGTMECPEDSIMYFSILRNRGWHIYIDGKEVDKIGDVNISFTGAKIPAGHHRVELVYRYPFMPLIIASTAAGFIMLIGIMIAYRRGRRMHEQLS